MRDGCMQLAKELVELLVIMFRPEVVDTSATKIVRNSNQKDEHSPAYMAKNVRV